MQLLNHLVAALILAAMDRHKLTLENVALRQQLIVPKRGKKRATLEDRGRVFWILLSRMIKGWVQHLVIVQPEAVLQQSHRANSRLLNKQWNQVVSPKRSRVHPPYKKDEVSRV